MPHFPLYEGLLALMREAGQIILAAREENIGKQVTEKAGTANFVTEFDVRVQDFLLAGVKELFPDAEFIAEEKENDVAEMTAEHCFIIDPIDGTTNFICDYHHSAISLALLERGVAVFGAVYDPYLDEMFSAERGKGAFCNGEPIAVSSRPIDRALVMFGTSPYSKDTHGDLTFAMCKKFFMPCADLRRSGSCALDLAYLAAGRIDIFFEYRTFPWDIMAGVLLIREAGGIITAIDGTPICLDGPTTVLAGSPAVYETALQIAKS